MILRLAISGYRSLRNVDLNLGRLTVVTGPNGSGKSSLYRALRLLVDAAQGRIVQSLAGEGGFDSTLWAGPEIVSRRMISGEVPVEGTRRKGPVALKLGFGGDDYGYAVDLGLPARDSRSAFAHDPQIKAEALWTGEVLGRSNVFAERSGAGARLRDDEGRWREIQRSIAPADTMLIACSDPRDAPELLLLREQMRGWRFFDQIRTDRDAPARRAQIGTHTPVLAGDGADLAAAVETIREIGDWNGFAAAIADAFPGAAVDTDISADGFTLEMTQQGLLRPLRAAELSEGTLRYIAMATALFSPRPPPLMVLNEPEANLHPDLLPALARLILEAAERSQLIVITHAAALVAELRDAAEVTRIVLTKRLGETLAEQEPADTPPWRWPSR